jgi:hypothetical protein
MYLHTHTLEIQQMVGSPHNEPLTLLCKSAHGTFASLRMAHVSRRRSPG